MRRYNGPDWQENDPQCHKKVSSRLREHSLQALRVRQIKVRDADVICGDALSGQLLLSIG